MERPRANADTVGLTRYQAGHFRHEPGFFWNFLGTLRANRSVLNQFQKKFCLSFAPWPSNAGRRILTPR